MARGPAREFRREGETRAPPFIFDFEDPAVSWARGEFNVASRACAVLRSARSPLQRKAGEKGPSAALLRAAAEAHRPSLSPRRRGRPPWLRRSTGRPRRGSARDTLLLAPAPAGGPPLRDSRSFPRSARKRRVPAPRVARRKRLRPAPLPREHLALSRP